MKKIAISLVILFSFETAISQTKQKDIDNLFQKYKNFETVTVRNANGVMKLAVNITKNRKGEPESITLTGFVDNRNAANSLVEKLEHDKEMAGYKFNSTATVNSDEILIVSVYTKGVQYAKYGVSLDLIEKSFGPPPYSTGTEEQKRKKSSNVCLRFRGRLFYLFGGGRFIATVKWAVRRV